MDDSNYTMKGEKIKVSDHWDTSIPGVTQCMSDSELDRMRADDDCITPLQATTVVGGRNGKEGLKVLFLSSDTGGGHRASAESLGKQFQLLFPGTTYELLDIVERDGVPPYNSLVSAYKHLSNRPSQWKIVYSVSNTKAFEYLADAHLKLMCEKAVRRRIQSYDPDVVVSVHPLMTNVPVVSCAKISTKTGRHLPMFTVVTDLGSAHCLWFANGVEKMFVGSEAVKELAMTRGKVPEEKIALVGLPIRHDFSEQAELLGDRFSREGRDYQRKIRQQLNIPYTEESCESSDCKTSDDNTLDHPTLLVMGGGEGVGSLENITDALYVECRAQGINATILVVCGRNEKLRSRLHCRDWNSVYKRWRAAKLREELRSKGLLSTLALTESRFPILKMSTTGCIDTTDVTERFRRIMKYTTGLTSNKGNKDMVTSVVSTSSSTPNSVVEEKEGDDTSFRCSSDEILLAASEVLAILPYGETKEDDRMNFDAASDEQCAVHKSACEIEEDKVSVNVVGLGFVENMAEYMVAADVLITKAGPGTISEAAALSLPILLTSFLPGQEEGNVDFVVDGGFGSYCPVADPIGIAEEVCLWLRNPQEKLHVMSKNAKLKGKPYAARDIAKDIGERTLRWVELNHKQQKL